ncbi:H+/gluconate symporter related permease [Bifidobacterium cuniculi]|uniref:H+/gluconate symporter related permease n=1 Tax=Bifidobacterium cuniculi TaxID=1688 RepID=A0A087B3K8_9BIFI|nr:H+/gluconate symporter related permease [Bifidobacterium cuniculi]
MIICAIGVFIPVAVLIVAPIAIEVGSRMHISKLALLVALSGGGKAGNIISPNPNAIAAASGFKVDLADVMVGSFVPALCGLAMAVLLATVLKHRGTVVTMADMDRQEHEELEETNLPGLAQSLVAPVVAVVLLMLGPIGSITHIGWLERCQIDAMYILPFAAIVGMLAMGKGRKVLAYTKAGMGRMIDVVMILIGAGAIGGLISSSDLPQQIVNLIDAIGVPGSLLAPISGILMAAATASTSTGVILAAGSFGDTILSFGTAPVAAAITMQAGATVIDALPQGNYFHVTAKSMNMTIGERMRVLPFEACVGLTMTIVATLLTIVW